MCKSFSNLQKKKYGASQGLMHLSGKGVETPLLKFFQGHGLHDIPGRRLSRGVFYADFVSVQLFHRAEIFLITKADSRCYRARDKRLKRKDRKGGKRAKNKECYYPFLVFPHPN